VVDRQFVITGLAATVLASEPVSLKYVASAKGDRCRGQSVILGQCDDFWHAESLTDSLDKRLVAIRNQLRPIVPVVKLVVVRVNDAS
jgi:hypothetical protein